jgi:hypothetical protein
LIVGCDGAIRLMLTARVRDDPCGLILASNIYFLLVVGRPTTMGIGYHLGGQKHTSTKTSTNPSTVQPNVKPTCTQHLTMFPSSPTSHLARLNH